MSAWRRNGAAVCLLAVFCVTAGEPSISLLDELEKLHMRLQLLDFKLGARMDALDNRLDSQQSQLDTITAILDSKIPRLDGMTTRMNNQMSRLETLPTRLDSQESQVAGLVTKNNSTKLQLDGMTTKMDNQTSRLEALTTRLDSQQSQLAGLATKLDSQQSQLVALTNTSNSERSRLERAVNETASQQTQIDELAARLDQVEELLKPRDCSQLLPGATSGVHSIWPALDRSRPPVKAYCDMVTHGGQWTVLQRRTDVETDQDFYLDWADYKRGFGDLTGEFWWGLEFMSQLTADSTRSYELRIDLEAFNGNKAHAIYQDFRISPEAEGYKLLSAANYTGDAGDGFRWSVNRKFSTRDRDQDGRPGGSCADRRRGAWWYSPDCGDSNLNGRYVEGGRGDWTGIWWYNWREYESLKKTVMMIRAT